MHIRALSGDIDAAGSFWGSLKGLAIAISLCDSEKHVIFLFFAILTMLWCFPGLGMADKSCSEHIAGTMGGCTLEHFQAILMPLGRFGGL